MGKARLAVFCSREGTNLAAILAAIQKREIPAKLALVLSDNPKARCLLRAQQAKVPTVLLDVKKSSQGPNADQAILGALALHQIDWVILAGYMRFLNPGVVSAYRNRILNIHPSLLPDFKGVGAIQKALEARAKVTGVTVHIVDEILDSGPIILQESVEILPDDTLESLTERIHAVEHRLYPKAIRLAVEGKLRIEGRQVRILK